MVLEDPVKEAMNPDSVEGNRRRIEFDYLRTCAILLVVAHHSILAYTTFAFINFENPVETFSPIVNEERWSGFDLIAGYNDTFFMSLLFLVSGLFVWDNLVGKGARNYLDRRLTRLGIPFLFGVLFLIPLAYYPAQLEVELFVGGESNYLEFWLWMVRSGFATSGPLWFLWLLCAFNCVASLLYRGCSPWIHSFDVEKKNVLSSPIAWWGVLFISSAVVYTPMAIWFGPHTWAGFGPFIVQVSRILLYLVYFVAGIVIGAYGLDRSALRADGQLAKKWWMWLLASMISYAVLVLMILADIDWPVTSGVVFAFCCSASVFWVTGIFLRFTKRRIPIFDSLSENSYGIYLIHYVFITWLQYLLLGSALHPVLKAMAVFAATLICSWGVIAAIRRIPVVAKVI